MSVENLYESLECALKDCFNAKVNAIEKAIYLKFETGHLFKLEISAVTDSE